MRDMRLVLLGLLVLTALLASPTQASPGITECVSVDSAVSQGNGGSTYSAIGAYGRFVAFYSHANNLVVGDTNGIADTFVHDRLTGATGGF